MLKDLKKRTITSLLCLASSGHAATEYLSTNLLDANFNSTNSTVSGHFGGLNNQASENVGNVPGNRYNVDFEFDYNHTESTNHKTGLERRLHAAAMVNDQNLTMYSIQEAYIGGNITSKDRLKFGRQILPWSPVDSTWGFGKLNNRRNFDYFTPGQEGLIGLQYERRSSNNMRYKLFVSGLYVPESNPALDINKKDRSITTRHAWGDTPATSAPHEGGVYNIKYDVDYPRISDVIYRYSIGANIGYESKHWVFDNFIMRKPENTTTPDVEVTIDNITDIASASIDPRFYYHDIVGSSVRYRNKDIEMYISGIAVRPNEYPDVDEDVRYTEIKNKKRREDYVGGGISRSNDLYTLAFNYVARLSPFDREKDDLAPDPRWNQAVNILAIRNFGQKIIVSTDLKYDMLTTDRLVMFRGTYKATKALHVSAGVNLIGTPSDGKSFWSPYTNNDAVYGGLRYVY